MLTLPCASRVVRQMMSDIREKIRHSFAPIQREIMKETKIAREEVMEIDLQKLLMAYLRKWWLILLCGLIVAGGALLYTVKFITPLYQASVSVYVNNSSNNQPVDYVTSSNLDASQKLVNTYINIAKSDRVLDLVAEKLNGDYTVKELREMLSAAQVDKTEIFRIYITSSSPGEAARVANVMAEVAPEEISNLIEGSSARIIDYAKVPEQRYSPSYKKNTMMGGLIGCVLAVAYLTALFLLDVRIRDDEDLTSLTDLPILGQIPNIDAIKDSDRKKYGYETEERSAGKGGMH